MIIKPLQDWMVLDVLVEKPSSIMLPDDHNPLKLEARKDLQAFRVLDIGGWETYPIDGTDHLAKHDIHVGDVVMVEGIGFSVVETDGKQYAVSRARNVIYKLEGEMSHLTSINDIKKGGSDAGDTVIGGKT